MIAFPPSANGRKEKVCEEFLKQQKRGRYANTH